MQYNTLRTELIIPEYGRHIHIMVDQCLSIENRTERNQFAEYIISVMGNLKPHLRDIPDFTPKLWDQLFIMADFKLDVDCPYETPTRAALFTKPDPIPYPVPNYKYRYYGKNVQNLVKVAIEWKKEKEDEDKIDALILAIANYMKKCYLKFNRDYVEDEVIWGHMKDMSESEISYKDSYPQLAYVDINEFKKDQNTGSKKKNHKNNNNNYKKKRR